jgi:hypothetical protein
MTRKWFAPLVAAGLVLLAVGNAPAGLLPTLVTVNPEGSNFRWSYAIVLPTDSELRTGDYFTIYDFAGLVDGSVVAPDSNWLSAVQMTTNPPAGVLPTDDASKPNLTFQYTGPTLSAGQVGLGNFMATSVYDDRTTSFFTARTHRAADGKVDTNITSTDVPVPGGGATVPEPATLLLAGVGLAAAAAGLRRKPAVG